MTIDAPKKADIPALALLWQQAFGDTEAFVRGFFETGFSPERCRCLYVDHAPAAVLYWFDCTLDGKLLAYLYAVATHPAHQGKGLCRRLMEDTHRHLQKLGYAGSVLVPGSQDLFSMYEKLGYSEFCPMTTQTVAAGKEPVLLQSLSPAQYLTLRSRYLPAGSVLQEETALTFYATYGQFYRTESGIFCAAREQDTLYFQEYLAAPSHLPGILWALQCKNGTVRLPGAGTAFAMYRGFGQCPMPSYFGIPLN